MTDRSASDKQREGPEAPSFGLTARIAKVTGAVLFVVLLVVLMLMEPAVPDRIRLLTGPEGSPYHELGSRYAAELGARGLTVEVLSTDGDLDNIRRLSAASDNTIAFAPSIIAMAMDSQVDTSALVSVGSIGFAPAWLFHRSDLEITRFAELAGHELATAGSGTVSDALARRLLELHGIADEVEIHTPDQATPNGVPDALVSGRLDAAFLTGSPQSELIQRLLHTDGVSLLSFEQAAAYAARLPGLAILEAPQGVFDLARNIPGEDSQLVGAATNLVASRSLHPAVAPILLGVAADMRVGSSTFFQASFPSDKHLAFPLAPSARRFFQQGETGLSKYLPYTVTRYLNHLGFLVLPILTVLAVLLKLVPTVLKGIGRLRLTGLYRQLEQIDRSSVAGENLGDLLADLDRLDATTATMFVPRALALEYVNFRQSLHDLGERVQSR
jgi:hypothetical protein